MIQTLFLNSVGQKSGKMRWGPQLHKNNSLLLVKVVYVYIISKFSRKPVVRSNTKRSKKVNDKRINDKQTTDPS